MVITLVYCFLLASSKMRNVQIYLKLGDQVQCQGHALMPISAYGLGIVLGFQVSNKLGRSSFFGLGVCVDATRTRSSSRS